MNTILVVASLAESRAKCKLAFDLIGVDSIQVPSATDALEIPPESISMVLVFALISDISPYALPGLMREKYPDYCNVPFVIATYNTHPKILPFSKEHGYARIYPQPHNRRFLYSILRDLRIVDSRSLYGRINENDLFNIVTDKEMIEFLGHLLSENIPEIAPVYDSKLSIGYYYPAVNLFFAVDSKDGHIILLRFFEHQALDRKLINRIHLCPKCLYHTVNFQEQCPKCSSIDFKNSDVIHHFNCGYVGEMSEFLNEATTQMICPKCGKVLRHIGMDYDKPAQMHKCNSCKYIFNESKVGMQCFHCNYIGDAEDAKDYDIYSYTVNKNTARIVERKSFDPSGLGIRTTKEGFMCYNKQAFSFILWQKYLEAEEFGDSISVIMFNTDMLGNELLRSTIEYIAEIKRTPDTVSMDETGRMLIMLPRATDTMMMEMVTKIKEFISRKLKSDSAHVFFHAEIIKPGKHLKVANILDMIYQSYDKHYAESSGESVFHEETFEEK